MSIDAAWEEMFSKRAWGKYPGEDVVRFIARNFYKAPNRKKINILDLGCGGGAHTWYLAREGFTVYAVDGSESAIKQVDNLLRESKLSANLEKCDINKLPYENEYFDAVIDSNSIQHNLWEDICDAHREVWRVLKPNGLFLGIMLGEDTTGWESGKKIQENTYRGINNGFFIQDILTHLFTRQEINLLMQQYENIVISQSRRIASNEVDCVAHYIVSAEKCMSR